MNREVFAQRFNADGEMLWEENGVWLWDIPKTTSERRAAF
jgi:hypothetical protein